MPADMSDRTEAPTPRRRTEAREKGQVARSADLAAALGLIGACICFALFGRTLLDSLLRFTTTQLSFAGAADAMQLDVRPMMATALTTLAQALGATLALLFTLGIAANVLQVGFLITGHPLHPSLDRINPLSGFKRMFSARTLVQLIGNILKLVLVVTLAWQVFRKRLPEIIATSRIEKWQALALGSQIVRDFAFKLAVALLLLAVLDFVWQRIRHERDLRMTREEVREEMRRMDGDPLLRQRRRQLQMRLAAQRLRRDVPRADVVVTNPTELAVALKYDAKTMTAPKVVAKGQGYMAQRIREIAREHKIPIIERKPLAQALFKAVEIGQEVPAQFYQAVAEILAYVYELARGRRRPNLVSARE